MKNNRWIIYDGEAGEAADPLVPAESRGLMYGDGCFETMRSYSGALLRPGEHLKRLREGLDFLGIVYPEALRKKLFMRHFAALLKKNGLSGMDGVVRVQVWRGGGRGYAVSEENGAHVSITLAPLPSARRSCSLATVDIKRIPDQALPSRFKLSNGINYITAAGQARKKEADDALMETTEGYLSETTVANIFWVKEEVVYTPSADCDLLPGITRNTLIRLMENEMNTEVKQGRFKLDDITEAEAVWACNSVREIVTVNRINEISFRTGHPFVNDLHARFINYRQGHLMKPEP